MVTESPSRPKLLTSLPRQAANTDCRLVDREEYCRLAISNQSLVRCDDPASSTRGLFDPVTGVRYAITEGNLFKT